MDDEQHDTPIRTVAVIGTGTVGASWAALFLAHGLDVIAFEPNKDRHAFLDEYIARAMPDLAQLGASAQGKLTVLDDPVEAVQWADFVQENATEDEPTKVELLARLDAAAAPDVIISSSTSWIPRSRLAARCRRPGRIIVGHPFNPPHLVPLVEIVGVSPDAEAVRRAVAFYASLGREPVVLRKEIYGHIANRLQAAIWRESMYLLEQGVADAASIDRAVRFGPGLRWAIMGPFLTFHLAGGQGGIGHAFDQFGPGLVRTWGMLGTPAMKEPLKALVTEGVERMTGGRAMADLEAERDESLKAILSLRSGMGDDAS
jgi:3-hydroxyacyl-CoA dehydrogenase